MSGFAGALVWMLLLALAAVFLYQLRIALHGLRVRASPTPGTDTCFAVIVPAYNEEAVIGGLLASLGRVQYPQGKLHVLVVADHCSDATAQMVLAAGYACLERRAGERGKAPSLVDGIAWMRANHPEAEAYAFFDADNVVDGGFFGIMATMIAQHPCLQGFTSVRNWDASVFSRLNYINAMAENRFRELGRSQAGLSCYLRGHGMVFRGEFLQAFQWQHGGMVEDYDMQLRLVLAGYRVIWVNEARLGTLLPESAGQAAVQRRRWAGGNATVRRLMLREMWGAWLATRSPVVFDQIALLVIPSHAVQLCLVFIAGAAAAGIGGIGSAMFYAGLILLSLYVAYFATGALLNDVRPAAFLSLPAAPFYIVWRTWIFLTSLKGVSRWR